MTLFICPTPIGNLEDITLRALRILKEADLILAEDTRRTNKLLTHYRIKNKTTSFNDFNKKRKTPFIISLLRQNKGIAMVSDAGTPGISDPAFYLVRECVKENLNIASLPGPTAAITALVASGLPTDRFTFYGFFPKKEGQKEALLNEIRVRKETAIFYESPHRIQKTLALLAKHLPDHNMVLARELTKKFEEFIRGRVKAVQERLKSREIRGEMVLLLHR